MVSTTLACAACGAPVLPADRFCPRCGAQQTGGGTPAPAASMELPQPDLLLAKLRQATLHKYDIKGELGRGGMAVVYLARELTLERDVAIKVMLPGLFLTQGMAERFLQEARIAARLDHANIIRVITVEQVDDLFYFVMNLVEGASVDELLRARTPLAVDEVRWVLMQAALALGYAHGEGIVHRDVKPANLLLNTAGRVIVSDFGIAKAGESSHLTRTGAAIGTPAYMSPEQLMGQEIGPASDQYSLGVAAYEMLTGSPPFTGPVPKIQMGHAYEAPPPLLERRPDCPVPLADAVMRMLAKRPEERWGSLAELAGVFGAGLPMDGGAAATQLRAEAVRIRDARRASHPAAFAPTPVSPVPQGKRPPAAPGTRPAMVRCTPQTVTLLAGESVSLRAVVTDAEGQPLSQVPLRWHTSDPAVVTVSPRGEVTALGDGRATVRVEAGDCTGEATITVERAVVTRLTVAPATLALRVHERGTLAARTLDARGQLAPASGVAWTAEPPGIVQVAADGGVHALAAGTATVRARLDAYEATATVTVAPAAVAAVRLLPEAPSVEVGDQAMLVAEALDATGQVLDERPVRWEVADARFATIDAAGVVTGVSPGRVRVRATIEGVAIERTLAVRPVPLVALSATLDRTAPLAPGDTARLVLTGRDARGRRVADLRGLALQFESSAPAVAGVADDGSVRAVGEGEALLTVRATPPVTTDPVGQALEATVRVVVGPEAVAALALSPATLALEVGATATVTATPRGRAGAAMTGRTVRWRSSAPAIVEVADGTVTARAAGEARLVAECDGVTAELPVTVTALGVHAVAIDPVAASLFVGDAVTLTARCTDRTGAPVPAAVVTWSSNAPAIAHVSDGGVVTANAPGEARVVARAGNARAQATIVVDAVPVVALAITPGSGTLLVGRTLALGLSARDARDREVSTLAMWTATPGTVASVSADGTVTARAPGTVTITATRGDVRAVATFTVEEAVPTALTVAPPAGPLTVGTRTTLMAALAAADGGAVSARVAWTSGDPTIARVSAEGMVEALSPGTTRIEARAAGLIAGVPVTVVAAPQKKPLPLGLIGGGVAAVAAIVAALALGGGSEQSPEAAAPAVEPAPPAAVATEPPVTGSAPPPAPAVATPEAAPPPPATVPGAAAAVASLTVEGAGALGLRETRQLRARGADAGGRPVAVADGRWSSSDPNVVTVDEAGRARGLRLGTATVIVRGAGATGRATMRVTGSHDDSVAAGLVARANDVAPARPEPPRPEPTPAVTAPPPAQPTTPPPAAIERGPSDGDVVRAVEQWVEQLEANRGRGAPASIAGFYRTGTNHDVAIAGSPAAGARDGDTREGTVQLELRKTGGAGELRRYRVTVTLSIGGSGGAARVLEARAGELK